MPAPEPVKGRRVAASAMALEAAQWPPGTLALRLAPDEVFVIGDGQLVVDDPHAIIEDDSGFSTVELAPAEARSVLARLSDWELSIAGPSLSQGLVAAIPVKVWLDQDRVLVIVPTPYAHDLEERLR